MVDHLEVHISIGGSNKTAGRAWFHRSGDRVSVDFTFDSAYLADPAAIQFDPAIPLVSGAQHFDGLPGSFQDCSPDRWGRNLIAKRSRMQAREDGRTPPSLSDIEFLTGVSDLTRQGALRFADGGRYTNANTDVPKLVSLPELLGAADSVEDPDGLTAVKALLDAGSGSLGGARPKASVVDDTGRLSIAKFPKLDDPYDVIGWEKTALDLAENAGLPVPARRIERVDGRSVLVLERFDRDNGARRAYVSAMTLVGSSDGDQRDYADIADSLSDFGADVAADLTGLYRRAVFGVAIRNTDDHLRNHGFVADGRSGWRLSPVFDVNPNQDEGAQRQTAICGAYGIDDESVGLNMLAEQCGLRPAAADQIIAEVSAAVSGWRAAAGANQISSTDIARFEPAFKAGLHTIGAAHHGPVFPIPPRAAKTAPPPPPDQHDTE